VFKIAGNFNFTWPDFIEKMFVVSDTASSGAVTSFSFGGGVKCLFYDYYTPLPMNEMKVNLWSLAFTIFVIFIFWIVKHFLDMRNKKTTYTMQSITVSLVVLLYNTYPNLVKGFFQLFSCKQTAGDVKLEDGRTVFRLVGSLDTICYSADHYKWIYKLGAPVATLMVVLPLSAWLIMRSKRIAGKLHDPDVVASYGFLYDGYKDKLFYWEIIALVRKVLLSSIVVFLDFGKDSYQQGLTALFLLGIRDVSSLSMYLYVHVI